MDWNIISWFCRAQEGITRTKLALSIFPTQIMPKRMGTINLLLHYPPLLCYFPWNAVKTTSTIFKKTCHHKQHSVNDSSGVASSNSSLCLHTFTTWALSKNNKANIDVIVLTKPTCKKRFCTFPLCLLLSLTRTSLRVCRVCSTNCPISITRTLLIVLNLSRRMSGKTYILVGRSLVSVLASLLIARTSSVLFALSFKFQTLK